MRAALQSEYDKEMSGKYLHQMIPFEDWLAQRNAPTGKAKGGSVMGINVASDRKAGRRYADLIVDGHKTLESRNGDSLRPYVGKRVAIVRTGEGPAKAIGEVTIGEPMVVNQKKFRSLEDQHHVPAGSAYDISTPTKHLYPLHNPVRYDQERDVGHGIVSRKVMATGGSVPSLDVMRLAIGGQGPKNWLKGSVEKVVEPLKSAYDPDHALEDLQQLREQHGELPAYARDERVMLNAKAMNKWIESNLGNYIRKQMGHPNDPVRKLAEEGILHFDPDTVPIVGGDESAHEHAESRRKMLGGQKMAKSPLAQAWEDAVDSRFEPNLIEDIRAMPDVYRGQHEPWMDKADPKTPLYELYAADELGFDHIVDILKQDLAEGRIRPEQLSKVSIEQAVRRVHQYDQERKKAMAETALKQTEGMPVHKDYGDGFKWIELAMPDKPLPEGYTPGGGNDKFVFDPQGNDVPHPNYKALEDALKYEGDTMGHCVGGYCPDVAEGRSRIFSLRDAKNEPHVTVEVKPAKNKAMSPSQFYQHRDVPPSLLKKIDEAEAAGDLNDIGSLELIVETSPEYKSYLDSFPPSINQIKGKGNAKPKKDYIPYVQDFVKSGNWSDVSDLQNAEMHRAGNLYTNNERKNLERLTGENLEYVAHQDIPKHRELLKQHNVPQLLPDEKADGGEVDAEEVFMSKGGKIKELEKYLRDREGEYGLKRLQRAADEIPGLENMYSLDALKRAFGGDNAQALMTMNPAEFERFAIRLYSDPDTREEEMNEPIEYVPGLPPMTHHEYIKYLAKIKGGFADVPFLEVNKRPEYLPNISGHEGRHRSRALVAKGKEKSLVRLFPSPSMREPMPRRHREDFIESMKKELGERRLVTGEGRSLLPADLEAPEHKNIERRNMLGGRPQLPEIYKDGGDVDAESAFFPKSKE